jgi:ABC-2 type transport system ATP-binding protein
MSAVIELDGLGVRFGRHQILEDLRGAFSGRAIGLLGPNGAGKTTLVHTLLGFHPVSEGTARVFGHDIRSETKKIRSLIGYMPENDAFIAGMSAVRLVRLMAELSGLPPREALERAHEALFYVGLGEARYRKLETYSLGMKQMAKLAQSIVHGPKLLFLDEPTNGLDPPHRRRMLDLINDIKDQGEVNIMISSHLLNDVEEVCDEVLILKDGKVAQYCDLEAERQANRKFIEIETIEHNAVFAEEIGRLGCEYALDGDKRLKMVLPEDVEIRDLYQIAADHQIRIRRLDYRRDSLKDIFLRAMEMNRGGL